MKQNCSAGAALLADSRRDKLRETYRLFTRICENRQEQLLLKGHSRALMAQMLKTKNPFLCVNLYDKNRRNEYCEGYLNHIYDNVIKAAVHRVAPPLAKDEKF
jgi:hypothetical protein